MRKGSIWPRGAEKLIGVLAALSMLPPIVGIAWTQEAGTIPSDWDPQISAAFLNEDGGLRSRSEIQANWGDLTADQRARILSDCQQATALDDGGPAALAPDEMGTGGGAGTLGSPPLLEKPSISPGPADRLSLLCSRLPDL